MNPGGVARARVRFYRAVSKMRPEAERLIMKWLDLGIPLDPRGDMKEIEDAAEELSAAKRRARNRRDKWKRKKRLGESSAGCPDASDSPIGK